MKLLLLTLLAILAFALGTDTKGPVDAEYIQNINVELMRRRNSETEAEWKLALNPNETMAVTGDKTAVKLDEFMKGVANEINNKFDWQVLESDDLRRQCEILTELGLSALSETEIQSYDQAAVSMQSYFDIKVCDFHDSSKCDIPLIPDVKEKLSKSRDPDELKYYWREFYDKAGKPARADFERIVELNAKAARLNDYASYAEMSLKKYEGESIEQQLEDTYKDLRPLYQQIHGYVRYRLRERYGKQVVSKKGPIPMHLLGNMWISDIMLPFPNKTMLDVTNEMLSQSYTPKKMFEMADAFFTSMNLTKLPQTFWEKSIMDPIGEGGDKSCKISNVHECAWDFYVKDDVRVMQCTPVTQDQFVKVHHDVGHIQYYLQYQNLPFVYRAGANPSFPEAVADAFALSSSTPKYLERVGLLKNYTRDDEAHINYLFVAALNNVFYFPFAFAMEKYRWQLFRHEIPKPVWNCAFWKLVEQYTGIEPPVVRSEKDFDAPAKFEDAADVKYLVSSLLKFQFYKSACVIAGQYEPNNPELPLHNCDIYGNVAAGNAFQKMLSMGASKPWPVVLEAFNGERKVTGKGMAEYFEPLRVWVEEQNKKNNVHIGWTKSNKCLMDNKNIKFASGHAKGNAKSNGIAHRSIGLFCWMGTVLILISI